MYTETFFLLGCLTCFPVVSCSMYYIPQSALFTTQSALLPSVTMCWVLLQHALQAKLLFPTRPPGRVRPQLGNTATRTAQWKQQGTIYFTPYRTLHIQHWRSMCSTVLSAISPACHLLRPATQQPGVGESPADYRLHATVYSLKATGCHFTKESTLCSVLYTLLFFRLYSVYTLHGTLHYPQ